MSVPRSASVRVPASLLLSSRPTTTLLLAQPTRRCNTHMQASQAPPEDAAAAAAGASPSASAPGSAALISQCKASLALSMLLLLKEYMKIAYSVNSERIEAFSTGGWVEVPWRMPPAGGG